MAEFVEVTQSFGEQFELIKQVYGLFSCEPISISTRTYYSNGKQYINYFFTKHDYDISQLFLLSARCEMFSFKTVPSTSKGKHDYDISQLFLLSARCEMFSFKTVPSTSKGSLIKFTFENKTILSSLFLDLTFQKIIN